jgi:hypothetical protein
MVPDKYRLETVGRHLIEAFERRRPAIAAFDAPAEATLHAEADTELAQMQRQLAEMGMDDPPYWAKVADAVHRIVIPRYIALAREENAQAARDYGLWRGGDIAARAAFAGAGLVLGALAVAIPWIPVTEKWVPWLLFVGGPFVPDAYFWWYHRRYRRRLDGLIAELAQAGSSIETYRPLSEVQRTLAGVAEGPAAAPDAQPVNRDQNKVRG